jgi:hypothetical protein
MCCFKHVAIPLESLKSINLDASEFLEREHSNHIFELWCILEFLSWGRMCSDEMSERF